MESANEYGPLIPSSGKSKSYAERKSVRETDEYLAIFVTISRQTRRERPYSSEVAQANPRSKKVCYPALATPARDPQTISMQREFLRRQLEIAIEEFA